MSEPPIAEKAVIFLWFLLGLTIGFTVLWAYHQRVNRQTKRLIRSLKIAALDEASANAALMPALENEQIPFLHFEPVKSDWLEPWRTLMEEAPIGFLQVDEENQLIWCNHYADQLLGLSHRQQNRPRLLLEMVRSYELDHLVEQTRLANQSQRQEWTFHPVLPEQSRLTQQQQARPLRASSFLMPDGSVGVFLEDRLEVFSLAQQRDRWTSDVAHELKTPLTSIRLVAETLQPRLEPALRHWIDRLLQETIRLSGLVQDLLDLNQLEVHSPNQLNLKPVDLPALVQSAWKSLEPIARRKSVQFSYSGPSTLQIQADEPRIYRVLLNLLDNSIKFSPPEALIRVTLRLRSSEDPRLIQCAHIEVIDSGPGFSDAALPHIFERFFRMNPGQATATPAQSTVQTELKPSAPSIATREFSTSSGSGLGLAIVRQIVEAHQGSVQASNHPETRGAWLEVFLPVTLDMPPELKKTGSL